ncbi:PREDICTED: WAT1-related protein At5g40210-like isoform X1 [Camelina sativa]|uniref:WAT1-related protein n=1 Tax=Camelina sativa TaxID=90675 RepID=A0ABM0V4P5_CAMSA|nr:PREDICTED: WAT1-related protein At5g40210-like isoform X1 [Camelina sativa]
MAPGRLCNGDGWILTAMVASEISNVGVNLLVKAATSKGLSPFVVLVYSYTFGSLLLLPLTFFSLRFLFSFSRLCFKFLISNFSYIYNKTPLQNKISPSVDVFDPMQHGDSWSNCNRSAFQIAGYNGIKYSSPTLSSAMSNVNPAFTFILAVIFRMENISLREKSSVAKVLGTLMSIIGALVVTLYHGPKLMSSHSDWAIGGGLLALQYILISVSYLVMAHTMSRYPSAVVVTLVHNICIAVVCAFVSLFAEKDDPKAWIIRFDINLISVVAMGTLNSGNYVIHTWAVSHKGPVYLSMFKPLSILIAATSSFIFLGESLYLGSVIGGIFISIGFYMVLWGKAKEDKVDILGTMESSSSSHKAPLLVN